MPPEELSPANADARRAGRFRHRFLIRLPEISHFDFSEPEA